MSGGGGDTVTRNEPPEFSVPFLESGLRRTEQDYLAGPRQYYPGNTVVPFADQTNAALNLQEQRALGGSPVTDAAQNLVTNTLSGDFLNGNPYIDFQINRAIQLSRPQLDSQFAGSGRDLEAQQAIRAEQVNNITQGFLYNNYNDERGRQNDVLSAAIPLANQDYVDIEQLGRVGGAVEGQAGDIIQGNVDRFDFSQNANDQNLNDYLSRVTGTVPQLGQTQIQENSNNPFLGAAGGALAGAQLGTILPFFGPALGAIGGGLLGAF